MLTNDLKQIILMNPVRINFGLKKHEVKQFEPQNMKTGGFDSDMSVPSNWNGNATGSPNIWDGVPFSVKRDYRSPIWRTVAHYYIKFRLLFSKPKMNPIDFFKQVKNNFEELENAEIDEEKLTNLLQILEQTGQKIALKSMNLAKAITEHENKLVDAGIVQYQTEESLIKFIRSSKKGLCLTEIEDFERIIPEEVMEKFDKAEALCCFDNYYILHFDPKKTENIYYTREQKKDPVLFGVIKGSNKLYYIADWIDEYCDLTYQDILKGGGYDFKLEKSKE